MDRPRAGRSEAALEPAVTVYGASRKAAREVEGTRVAVGLAEGIFFGTVQVAGAGGGTPGRDAIARDVPLLARTATVHGRATGATVIAFAAHRARLTVRRGGAQGLRHRTRPRTRQWTPGDKRRSRRSPRWSGEGSDERLIRGAQHRRGLRWARRRRRWRDEETESYRSQKERE